MSFFTTKKLVSTLQRVRPSSVHFARTCRETERLSTDQSLRIRWIGVLIIGVAIFIYIGWQAVVIVKPPRLAIFEPQEIELVHDSRLLVSGQVDPKSELTMNHELLLPDATGYFSQIVYLLPGKNTLIFEAQKQYGKKSVIIREVYYSEPIVKSENIKITN